jgi:hypothetical protein
VFSASDLKGASHEGAQETPVRGPRGHLRDRAREPGRKVKLLEVAPEPALIDSADNRTNGKGK